VLIEEQQQQQQNKKKRLKTSADGDFAYVPEIRSLPTLVSIKKGGKLQQLLETYSVL